VPPVTIVAAQTTHTGDTTAGPAAVSSGEFRGLTGLRIVAAVWVVAFHFHFTPSPGVTEVVGVLGPLITSGALGVDLFFVLSGFVIAHTYLDRLGPALHVGDTARYVWARICRMWPLYALVVSLFGLWLAARAGWGHDDEIAFQAVQPVVSGGEWLAQLGMVHLWDDAFLDGASWVGPTWTISAEWLAYLLFPVAALGFFRLRNLPAGLLAAASVALMLPIAMAYLSSGHPYYPGSWLVRVLCGFGAGVLMLLAVRRLHGAGRVAPERVRRAASVLAWAVPLGVAAGLWFGELLGAGRGGAVIVLFPLVVGALALADRGPARVLSGHRAVYGGRISYALYLVHIPMFEIYWVAARRFPELAPDTLLGQVLGLAVLLGTVPVAMAAYHRVEEPARRRLRALAPVAPDGGSRDGGSREAAPRGSGPHACSPLRPRRRGGVFRPAGRPVPCPKPAPSGQAVARPDLPVRPRPVPGLPGPRHAATPHRRPTLAAALVKARTRPPAHRVADIERAIGVRSTILHAGS